MKILHVTNTLEEGGVESLVSGLATGMAQAGHLVTILSLRPGKPVLIRQLEEMEVKVLHCGNEQHLYSPAKFFALVRFLREHRYDVIHSHLFPTQYYVAIARSLSRKNANAIYGTTEHGMINGRRSKKWLRGVERYIYSRYDFVVGVSQTASQSLQQWLGPQITIHTIENGLNIAAFRSVNKNIRSIIRQKYHIPEHAKVLIMAARFYEAKDHYTLIRSMQYLPDDYHLLLVGSGPLLTQCQNLCSSLKLETRIHFVGYTDQVNTFIAASDIGVLASHHEGCPISLVEYMTQGLPIIGSDIESIRAVVGDAGIFFPNGDANALAEKVLLLTTPPERYAEFRCHSLTRAEHFDLTRTIDNYLGLYHNILSACKKT